MSDFISDFWGVYIAVITLASIAACGLLLQAMSTRPATGASIDTTGHVWDEDLTELNNPLPRWWMWLFWITIVFGLGYLALYPGLGTYKGLLGWSSKGQYVEETAKAEAEFGPLFKQYLAQDLKQVAADPKAMAIAQKLFLNSCAQCHGSDAGGGNGFPNLRDKDWLWGGEPETIKTTILEGRNGVMPPMGAAIGGAEATRDVANYVLKLSGGAFDVNRAERGREKFQTICGACHTPAGTGNIQLGAPNLTDKIWLFGGSEATIVQTITNGRSSQMPAHKDFLGEPKVHLLAAYVWGLSDDARAPAGK